MVRFIVFGLLGALALGFVFNEFAKAAIDPELAAMAKPANVGSWLGFEALRIFRLVLPLFPLGVYGAIFSIKMKKRHWLG